MSMIKTCVQCGQAFPEKIIIDGVERTLRNRKKCFDCTPFQSSHNAQRYRKPNGLSCISCGKPLVGKQTMFCSNNCKMQQYQAYPQQQERGLSRKIYLVMQAGGECQRCGFDEHLGALTFHHREPAKKKFKLDMRSLSNRSWKSVLREFSKCDLLCANCHSREHSPHLPHWKVLYNPNYADDYDA